MKTDDFGERLQLGAVVQQLIESLKDGEAMASKMVDCISLESSALIFTLARDGRTYRLIIEDGKKDDE